MQSLNLVQESIILAFRELRSNKLRTFLSLLGVTIGVFCIIGVITIVDNLELNVRKTVHKLGDNVVYVQKWPWAFFDGEYEWWKYWKRPVPNMMELKLIRDKISTMDASTIFLQVNNMTVKSDEEYLEGVQLMSFHDQYDEIRDINIDKGRYFSITEIMRGHNSVVMGAEVASRIFPFGMDPIGRSVRIEDKRFTVIGVLDREGESALDPGHDNSVLVPYNYMRKLFDLKHNRELQPFIMARAKEGVNIEMLKEDLRGVLRSSRKLSPKEEDDFALNQVSLIANQLDDLFKYINLGGWIIGGFALLVGGFGIANIMFVSVRERTSVIGLKKALGAKSYVVLMEFLIESVVLCLLGGLIGLVIVGLLVLLVRNAFDVDVVLLYSGIVISVIISASIGLLAGVIPAYIASRMDPVEAMRFK